MRTYPIFREQSPATGGATHMSILTAADLQALAAGNTGTVAAFTQKGGSVMAVRAIEAVIVSPLTFSDAAIVSCAVTAGDAGSATRYLASTEVSSPGGATAEQTAMGALASMSAYLAANDTVVNLYLTGTAAHNLSTCTGGEVIVFWQVLDNRFQG